MNIELLLSDYNDNLNDDVLKEDQSLLFVVRLLSGDHGRVRGENEVDARMWSRTRATFT